MKIGFALKFVFLATTAFAFGQEGTTITFHVTGVSQKPAPDFCDPNVCTATEFTVEGYARVGQNGHRTNYVLKCDETLVNNPPHYTLMCDRIHANNDYDAKLFGDSIMFLPDVPSDPKGPFHAAYSIQSEKEASQ